MANQASSKPGRRSAFWSNVRVHEQFARAPSAAMTASANEPWPPLSAAVARKTYSSFLTMTTSAPTARWSAFLFACSLAIITPRIGFARNRFPVSRHSQASATPRAASQLAAIAPVVEEAIRSGATPGAVVEIGHDGRIVYRRAFGNRTLLPRPSPMTVNTLFDFA